MFHLSLVEHSKFQFRRMLSPSAFRVQRKYRRQRASVQSVQETEGGGGSPAVAAVATFKALIY